MIFGIFSRNKLDVVTATLRFHSVSLRASHKESNPASLRELRAFTQVMSSAKFSFEHYLETLCPGEIQISLLTGGLVNVTARARRTSNSSNVATCVSGESSFILKYAPPFIASIGEAAPFSQFRQVRLLFTSLN